MFENPVHTVDTQNYTLDFSWVNHQLLKGDFHVKRKASQQQFNVFSVCWVLVTGRSRDNSILFKVDGCYVPAPEFFAVFIPPFSIVDWIIGEGSHQLSSYTATKPYPDTNPEWPLLFPIEEWTDGKVMDTQDIFNLVAKASCPQLIRQTPKLTYLARKIKTTIDQSYRGPDKIEDLVQQLGVTRKSISRSFGKHYGMTPSAYRNWLRVSTTVKEVVFKNQSVTNSAFNSGIEDSSQFSNKFKKLYDVPIRNFKPKSHIKDFV